MTIGIVLLILFAHFVADFVCQTDDMAINKSKSNRWLTAHSLVYLLVMSAVTWYWMYEIKWWNWLLLNWMLHWAVDYFTSRLNAYLWKKEGRHWFFVGIGADQLIHYTLLFSTYQMLYL